jgi:hypothetical protein
VNVFPRQVVEFVHNNKRIIQIDNNLFHHIYAGKWLKSQRQVRQFAAARNKSLRTLSTLCSAVGIAVDQQHLTRVPVFVSLHVLARNRRSGDNGQRYGTHAINVRHRGLACATRHAHIPLQRTSRKDATADDW